MLFVDWISTPHHNNFNRSFFAALALKNAKLIVFSEEMIIPEVECSVMNREISRLKQAINILKILWRHQAGEIVLLTYDSLFLPLVHLLNRRIVVYEHNTTPEIGSIKHYIWQKLFFGNIIRMAQFPMQYERLLSLGAKATYIGSPIQQPPEFRLENRKSSNHLLFMAPSFRAEISDLAFFEKYLIGSTILVKKTLNNSHYYINAAYRIVPLDRIEFIYQDQPVDAVIITVQSPIRGSGWFNDAISNSTPIIVTNRNIRRLFEVAFPGYPFIDMLEIADLSEFHRLLENNREFDSHTYARMHNIMLKKRFSAMFAAMGASCDI
jgi:hypothetical protein